MINPNRLQKKSKELAFYYGQDYVDIQEQYRREYLNQKIERLELKTLWKHNRSTKRAKESTRRASQEINKMGGEIDALSTASSKYR